MADPSEQISSKWVEGIERVCAHCGAAIKNLQRDVGTINRTYEGRRVAHAELICSACSTRRR